MAFACVSARTAVHARMLHCKMGVSAAVTPLAAVAAEMTLSQRVRCVGAAANDAPRMVMSLAAAYATSTPTQILSPAQIFFRARHVDELADMVRDSVEKDRPLNAEGVVAVFEKLVNLDQPNVVWHPAYVNAIRPRLSRSARRAAFKLDLAAYERILQACATLGEDDTLFHGALATSFLWSSRLASLESEPIPLMLRLVQHGLRASHQGARVRQAAGVQAPHDARPDPAAMDIIASYMCQDAGPGLSHSAALEIVRSQVGDTVLWCRTPDAARVYRRIGLAVQHRMWTLVTARKMKAVRFPELSSLVGSAVSVIEHEFVCEARVRAGPPMGEDGDEGTGAVDRGGEGSAAREGEEARGAATENGNGAQRDTDEPTPSPFAPSHADAEAADAAGTMQMRSLPTVSMSARLLHLAHAYMTIVTPKDANLREFWVQRATPASAGSDSSSSSSSGSESEGDEDGPARGHGQGQKRNSSGRSTGTAQALVPAEGAPPIRGISHGSPRAVAAHFSDALPVLFRGVSTIHMFDLGETGAAQIDQMAGVQTMALQEAGGVEMAVKAYGVLVTAMAEHFNGVAATASHVRKHWKASQAALAQTGQGEQQQQQAGEAKAGAEGTIAVARQKHRKQFFTVDPSAAGAVGSPDGPDTHPKYRVMYRCLQSIPPVVQGMAQAARSLGLVTWSRWSQAGPVGPGSEVDGAPAGLSSADRHDLLIRTYGALERVLNAYGSSAATRSPDVPAAAAVAHARRTSLSDLSRESHAMADGYDLLQALNVQLGFLTPQLLEKAECGHGIMAIRGATAGLDCVYFRKPQQSFVDGVVTALSHHAPAGVWQEAGTTTTGIPTKWTAGNSASGDDAASYLTLLVAALRAGIRSDVPVPDGASLARLSPRDAGSITAAVVSATGGGGGAPTEHVKGAQGVATMPLATIALRCVQAALGTPPNGTATTTTTTTTIPFFLGLEDLAASCTALLLRDGYQAACMAGGVGIEGDSEDRTKDENAAGTMSNEVPSSEQAAASVGRLSVALECIGSLEPMLRPAYGQQQGQGQGQGQRDRAGQESGKILYYAGKLCSVVQPSSATLHPASPSGAAAALPSVVHAHLPSLLRIAASAVKSVAAQAREEEGAEEDGAAAATIRAVHPDVVHILRVAEAHARTDAARQNSPGSATHRSLVSVHAQQLAREWLALVEAAGGLARASHMQTIVQEVDNIVAKLSA